MLKLFFRKCPRNLAATLAREVTDQIKTSDVSECVEPPEDNVSNPDKEENLGEDEDNKAVEEGQGETKSQRLPSKSIYLA